MSTIRTFLAEAYAPSSAEFAVLLEQARHAAAQRSRSGAGIRHVRSILVREDETCLHLFEAESVEALAGALQAAALRAHRIVEVAS